MVSIDGLLMTAYVKAAPILAVTNADPQTKTESSGDWSVASFLDNLGHNVGQWGSYILLALGFAAIIAGAYMLVTGLISHGKKQTSWPVVILLFVVGGAMAFGGWSLIAGTISAGMSQTVQNWGTAGDAGGGTASGGFILPFLPFL